MGFEPPFSGKKKVRGRRQKGCAKRENGANTMDNLQWKGILPDRFCERGNLFGQWRSKAHFVFFLKVFLRTLRKTLAKMRGTSKERS